MTEIELSVGVTLIGIILALLVMGLIRQKKGGVTS